MNSFRSYYKLGSTSYLELGKRVYQRITESDCVRRMPQPWRIIFSSPCSPFSYFSPLSSATFRFRICWTTC